MGKKEISRRHFLEKASIETASVMAVGAMPAFPIPFTRAE